MKLDIDPEKKNSNIIALLLVLVIGSFAYSYYLSTTVDELARRPVPTAGPTYSSPQATNKSDDGETDTKFKMTFSACTKVKDKVAKTEEEIEEEDKNLARMGMGLKAAKFKTVMREVCPPVKFCDTSNVLKNIQFSKKSYESNVPELMATKGTYTVDSNTITIRPTVLSKRILDITSWDSKNSILEIAVDGKLYNSTLCKPPELEQIEANHLAAEVFNKESLEKVKARDARLEKERLDKEIKDRAKGDRDILEELSDTKSKLDFALAELKKLENERQARVAAELAQKENEEAARAKIEKEKAKKMKRKIKAF